MWQSVVSKFRELVTSSNSGSGRNYITERVNTLIESHFGAATAGFTFIVRLDRGSGDPRDKPISVLG
jgi:hypothetical protein